MKDVENGFYWSFEDPTEEILWIVRNSMRKTEPIKAKLLGLPFLKGKWYVINTEMRFSTLPYQKTVLYVRMVPVYG